MREHPRVCGENFLTVDWCEFECGTSPRMRGKPTVSRAHPHTERNIPAYAGKTMYVT